MINAILETENDGGLVTGLDSGALNLRAYQEPVFTDHKSGIVVLHWSRQIGKSYALAAWAVCRLLLRPGRLVTVLSNSRENGAEFLLKCSEICRLLDTRFTTVISQSPPLDFEDYRLELRIPMREKTGRIKVLAANPRTARGFSGDLILDEFAFHENSQAIWDAAEPILASNPDFLCRIASTGNGRHNMFYRIAHSGLVDSLSPNAVGGPQSAERMSPVGEPSRGGPGKPLGRGEEALKKQPEIHTADSCQAQPNGSPSPGGEGRGEGGRSHPTHSSHSSHKTHPPAFLQTTAGFKLSRIPRTLAYSYGLPIYDPQTREAITPEQARAQALDKRAYDQNYECSFADENLALLTHELITAAEDDSVGQISDQDWSPSQLSTLRQSVGPLYVGFDIGRNLDLSVITVLEKITNLYFVRAILRLRDLRLPDQELRLGEICRLPRFQRATLDMTGLGLGLFEYAQKSFGSRICGINFASTVPTTNAIQAEGRKRPTVRVTESLATELLRVYEDRRIRHPRDGLLRDDLRKPEKVTSPSGQVSIAATRDQAGHADHFWSLALALDAAGGTGSSPFAYQIIPQPRTLEFRPRSRRRSILI